MQHRRYARYKLALFIGLVLAPILSCEWFASKGPTIAEVVLARDVKPGTLEPIETTDVYPQDQPEFHALIGLSNAPSGTVIKAVWTAIDVGEAAPANTIVGESEQKAQGTQNLHFAVSPDFGNWPPGTYRLDVYLNGALDKSFDFKVAPSATKTERVATVCPALPVASLEASDIVASVTMARDVKGEDKKPVDETTVFSPSATYHAVVLVEDAPKNTKVRATWYATDLGEPSSCNTKLFATDVVVDDTRNIDFSLSSKIPWPEGQYRVEISVNGELVEVVPFEVKGGAPGDTTP